MPTDFVIGQIYNRRKDIHGRFGGQRQSGIVTPKNYPAIFLFTGRGTRHGYEDMWTKDGALEYFGEGQKGNMVLTKGNKAIATHAQEGKELLMFEMLGGGQVRFRGPFNCAGYSFVPGKDTKGNIRQALVFELVPAEDEGKLTELPPPPSPTMDKSELRQRAFAAAGPPKQGQRKEAAKDYKIRSERVRQWVLVRADGICESCGHNAPFKTKDGRPYLESHHIHRLTDDGPDDPRSMAAICPTCHREIHHGSNGPARNDALKTKIEKKEGSLSAGPM